MYSQSLFGNQKSFNNQQLGNAQPLNTPKLNFQRNQYQAPGNSYSSDDYSTDDTNVMYPRIESVKDAVIAMVELKMKEANSLHFVMNNVATKDDLMAMKEDMSEYATKEDLNILLNSLKAEIQALKTNPTPGSDQPKSQI